MTLRGEFYCAKCGFRLDTRYLYTTLSITHEDDGTHTVQFVPEDIWMRDEDYAPPA